MHVEAKKLLKRPSRSKVSTAEIFLLWRKRFNMDEYVFGAALESSSLEVILRI